MRVLIALFFLCCASLQVLAAEPSKIRASSFVVLAEPKLPVATEFRAALEARFNGKHKIDDMESDDKKVILLRIRGGTVMVGLVDAKLPAGTVDDLCKGTWYWRAACEVVARHTAHVYVATLDTNLDQLDAALLQNDVVASLMDGNAIASYWGASLQSKDTFLKQSASASRDNPPVWLWVNFRMTSDQEKGWSLSTQGMETFGLNEIETKDAKRDGRDIFTLLHWTAQYLIQKGAVIKDGETIGESPALNIRVRRGPSYWRDGVTVYRVVYP